MLEEDLDDTHLCIKCSATIVGLDNYVQHRKTNCGNKATTRGTIVGGYGEFEYPDAGSYVKTGVEATGGKVSKTLSDPYDLPYELGADVFFSSLQLQSVQASSGGKATSSHQILTRKATATLLSTGRDEAESGDWEAPASNNSDNLMKVVRDIGETKKFETIFKPITFANESPEPYQSDDDEENDDDFDEDDDEDEDYVPTPYSGGKWKPGSQPAARSSGKWKSKPKTAALIPASHTGGKWNFKNSSKRRKLDKSTSDNLLSQIRAKLKSNSGYVPKKAVDSSGLPEVTSEAGANWKPVFSKSDTKWKSSSGQESPDVLEAHSGPKWKPGTESSTSGKWKPGEEASTSGKWRPGQEPSTSGKWKPGEEPSNSGKWKPGQEPSTSGKSSSLKHLKLLVPPPLSGGKWKAHDGNESPEVLETHTGGKWKPGQGPTSGGKWKPEDRPAPLKAAPEKPVGQQQQQQAWDDQETWVEEHAGENPPSEYTKGKWVPGTKVDRLEYKDEELLPSEDFWCNICCRKLKTRTIYERHLKSGVHSRRSETEKHLERAAVQQLELSKQILRSPSLLLERNTSPQPEPGKRRRRKIFIKCEICKHRMPRYLVGKHLISHYHYVRMTINPKVSFAMVLDYIHQIVLQSPFQCSPCRFYTNTVDNFLNHWNSVEHQDRTEGPGKFWCSFCRFECEDNNQMRRHLLGTDHREVILAINRSVPICISKKVTIECPKCHQVFRFNMELRQHAVKCEGAKSGTASDEYQSRYRCALCPDEVLKSKIALQRHEKFKHNTRRYYCSVCKMDFENPATAVKHRKSKLHRQLSAAKVGQTKKKSSVKPSKDLRCEKCDHVSSSDVEAMLHRITHPDTCKPEKAAEDKPLKSVKAKTEKPSTVIPTTVRKCSYCKKTFNNKMDLKSHLNTVHPEAKHVCPLCGEAFTLSQELGCHRRYKSCIASTSKHPPTSPPIKMEHHVAKKVWKCSDCIFNSAFESELIFHRIIHTDGVDALNTDIKLKCPLCAKSFSRHSLRHHLRQHTNEKMFQCEVCKRSFSRRHNYKEHMQYLHGIEGEKRRKTRPTDERFICDTCGKIFQTKYSLQLHINIHLERDKKFMCSMEGCQYIGRNTRALNMHLISHLQKTEFQCPEEGCTYKGKSDQHLKRHAKIHLEFEKIYKCPECDFKAKIPAHIRRHIRVHTGERPHACPHCNYRTGYIENLRKHILTTKKHPGKFIYECTQCDSYKTNFNADYQMHLMEHATSNV